MASTDSFSSSNQPTRPGNPFADKSYSDSFVRATTAPLAKRTTRPLQATPEMVSEKLRKAQEQISLCSIIIERFAPRMKMLKAAEALAKGPAAPAPAPVAEPEPAPKPGLGKPGLAKKPLGKAAPKPGAAKPAAKAPPAPPGAAGLNAQEKTLVTAMADRLRQDPELLRRAQIAVFQFEDAQQAVQETSSRIAPIQQADPQQAWEMIEGLEVSKLQGKVYPICNFHEIFKRDPVLSRVFPPPNAQAAAPGMAPPPGMGPPAGPMPGGNPMGTGPLGTGALGSGPLNANRGFFKR